MQFNKSYKRNLEEDDDELPIHMNMSYFAKNTMRCNQRRVCYYQTSNDWFMKSMTIELSVFFPSTEFFARSYYQSFSSLPTDILNNLKAR